MGLWFARGQVLGFFALVIAIGCGFRIARGHIYVLPVSGTSFATVLNSVQIIAGIFTFPLLIPYILSLFVWPVWHRDELPVAPWVEVSPKSPNNQMACLLGDEAHWKIHFRIVTRGDNKQLVSNNCWELYDMFQRLGLDESRYCIEVATDNSIECSKRSGIPVDEIVVPVDYQCPHGAKWKARALHFAVEHVSASPEDWIVHLDEETKLDERTVRAIWAHAQCERAAVKSGEQEYPHLGQGCIMYGGGKHGRIESWFTTLADSIRVGDDFGSFRLAFMFKNKFTFGMKGSFVVANQQVEELVSWDLGPALSLTEDAAFNMRALSEFNIGTAWIDAFMYEQSPFGLKDFLRQRDRWFQGVWACAFNHMRSSGPYKWKVMPVVFKMIWWTLSPYCLVGFWLYALSDLPSSYGIEVFLVIYLVGFFTTYSVNDGFFRYFGTLFIQIVGIPLFTLVEACAISWATYKLVFDRAEQEFHIVEKETISCESKGAENGGPDQIKDDSRVVRMVSRSAQMI